MRTTESFIKSFDKPSAVATGVKRLSLASACKEFLFDLANLRISQLLITCVLLLTLLVPVGGYLSARLFDQVGDNLSRARAISLFIEAQPAEKLAQLPATLSKYPQIERADLVPAAVEPAISTSATTHLVEVIPVAGLSEWAFAQLAGQLGELPSVELVSWSTETLERNQQASSYAQLLTVSAYVLTALLATLVVWRLIRRNIRISKTTIDLKHQLGATATQLRQPLLFRGLIIGLIIGVTAYAMVTAGSVALSHYVDITIFKFKIPVDPAEIFLYFSGVMLLSLVISQAAFRKEFPYLFQ